MNASASGQLKLGGFSVNRLGYGAMRITGNGIWGPPADKSSAISVLKKVVELGVNFIDTADAYGPNVSEELICEALHPYDGVVIATKGGLVRKGPGIWESDASPAHLKEALSGSLKRLKVGSIDLYQLHRPDPKVDFKDSLKALIEFKNSGKIKNIGLSNVSLDQLKAANELTDIVSVQNRYNVFDRNSEDVLGYCQENKIAFIPYFPIGGNGADFQVLEDLAAKYRATARQIGLAWLLKHSLVMLPIPGTSSIVHLEENIAASDIKLSDEDYRLIAEQKY